MDWSAPPRQCPSSLAAACSKFDLTELATIDGPFFQTWDLAGPVPQILKTKWLALVCAVCRRQTHAGG
jgi:hypothetical protein